MYGIMFIYQLLLLFKFMDIISIILILPAIAISLIAQQNLKATYGKYSKIATKKQITGIEAAHEIINNEGLNILTEKIDGELTDHYDGQKKVIRISTSNTGSSIASIAVVAHEIGHALQDKENSFFFRFRTAIVPVVNIGTNIGYLLIILGFALGIAGLPTVGIYLFSLSFIFLLITLPLEYDASNRAIKLLTKYSLLEDTEIIGARKVLNAAAYTYVSATLTSLLELISMIIQSNRR